MSNGIRLFENAPTAGQKPFFAPLIWGLVLPPIVTAFGVVVLLWSDLLTGWPGGFRSKLMFFLFTAGMMLLCSTLILCCVPVQSFRARIKEFRFTLAVSALTTLLALVVGVDAIAEQSDGYHGTGVELFLLPLLLGICAVPLWLSVGKMENRLNKILTLGGFFAATVLVQLSIFKSGQDYEDERTWMLNSMLVGLAFFIWLCAWGAKEFRGTELRP